MNKHKLLSFSDEKGEIVLSKRKFLKNIVYGSLLAIGGSTVAEARIGHFPSHKTLSFEHIHTGDRLRLTYFEQGRYLRDALAEINYLLRDFRTGSVHPIDTDLLDQLYDLKLLLGIRRPFHIVSGYRSPSTNAKLRRASRGVSKHSLHMQGRAIDIRVERMDVRLIRNAAIHMARGGVGYYPGSDFVHLDTGRFRTW
nr:YcbK family protein [Methylosarcina fibrata]